MKSPFAVIGSNIHIDIVGLVKNVPAKVDTGADSSAIWASNIYVDKEGFLNFTLFGESSDLYTGESHRVKDFNVALVKSSSGHTEIRYRVFFTLSLCGKKIKTRLNLSNREAHKFPVLIGRRTLKGRFLVDVAQQDVTTERLQTKRLNDELAYDPYSFYQKYHQKGSEG